MVAEICSIDMPVISGFISDNVHRILSSSMVTIWDQYKPKIKSGLQTVIQFSTVENTILSLEVTMNSQYWLLPHISQFIAVHEVVDISPCFGSL